MIKRFISLILLLLMTGHPSHAEEDRPKIGLVLGGGGALGFAHIGVLKVLEENKIPIDYIGGTSMGSIVAGMYACGMSPDEIEDSFARLNWWEVLKDKSPHQMLVYRRKEENKRFMGTEFGFNDFKFMYSPGMSHGQKLNNVLETFALNSTGISDFDQLNIPYRAIATDLRKGESVVLKSGSLAQAMRASMAVPGVFTPVVMGDRVFIDGGIYNNIPVNVVKEMGADIIIAVDVGASSAAKSAASNFNSLGEVIGRTYTIMQRPDQEKQLAQADMVIAPELNGYSSSQFHKVTQIVPQGFKAAKQQQGQLLKYSVDDQTFAEYLKKQRKQHEKQIVINEVSIEGNEKVSTPVINYRVNSEPGPLDLNQVYNDVSLIHGMGYFQTVSYDIDPADDAYRLRYITTEKFWGPAYLHFGIKFELTSDAPMIWSVLLNYTRTQLNAYAGEIRVNLEAGGRRRYLDTEWYQPFTSSGRFFITPGIYLLDEDIDIYVDNDDVAKTSEQEVFGTLDLGMSGFNYGEARVGILGGHAWDEGHSGIIDLGKSDESVVGLTTKLIIDQLDDPVFPSKGYQVKLAGLFADEQLGSSSTFNKFEIKTQLPLSLGRHTLTTKLSAGTSLGTDIPFFSTFHLGGIDSFSGYAPYQLFGNYYGLVNLGYRYRLGKLPPTLGNGIYALARVDWGNTWLDSNDIDIHNMTIGGSTGLAADTIVGRCIATVGLAEGLGTPRFYLSIGNNF